MNVFEDLIEELKEENLLEETVIETHQEKEKNEISRPEEKDLHISESSEISREDLTTVALPSLTHTSPAVNESDQKSFEPPQAADKQPLQTQEFKTQKQSTEIANGLKNKNPIDDSEFYRKRAIDEVNCLQMIEHVLSGVEREQMKAVPKTYDDLGVKKALHTFLQVSKEEKSVKQTQLEFQLMQETESWCSVLSHRDKRVSVAHLRRYCETTRPGLSSQALIALARFYRNLPYSESVRSKFDLVVTRLFSKDVGGEKRELVFGRDELIQHLKELYAEWSSIQIYSTADDDSEIVLAALKFEDFITEAKTANSFEELIKNNFFNRLRLFKTSTNELFYAPLVTATAVECSVAVGNKYIELIEAEKGNVEELQNKYGFLHDQAISDATSKTLQLVELLKDHLAAPNLAESKKLNIPENREASPSAIEMSAQTSFGKMIEKVKDSVLGMNKWLALAAVAVIAVCAGLYVWAEYFSEQPEPSAGVIKVNLNDASFKDYIQSARISDQTFFGVTSPAWNLLSREKKEEVLKKIYAAGADKGYKKVHLLDKEGNAAGHASAEKTEIVAP